ncbi:hypothetical protein FHT00_002929 [Sphingomonas insulae]|nr:hypothetical protein [Sphingomonas insulae]
MERVSSARARRPFFGSLQLVAASADEAVQAAFRDEFVLSSMKSPSAIVSFAYRQPGRAGPAWSIDARWRRSRSLPGGPAEGRVLPGFPSMFRRPA